MVKDKKKKIIIGVLGIIVVAVAAGYTYIHFQLNKINKVDIPKTNEELNISNTASNLDAAVVNIALFGVDRRYPTEEGRSDSLMILSIDKTHNKLKLSSIMRDTYVNVEGHGMNIITHAYAYGGAALAVKTLNTTFDLNIKNYVTVDFFGLEKIIDSVGGIDLNITSEEVKYINGYISETSKLQNEPAPYIKKSGLQRLNGRQAVAYCRIRYTEGGDFKRTERQRTVLTKVLEKVKAGGITKFPSIVTTLLPYTETNLDQASIIKLGTSILTTDISTIDTVRFPVEGYYQEYMINGTHPIEADLKALTDQLHKFIYDDQKPTPGAY